MYLAARGCRPSPKDSVAARGSEHMVSGTCCGTVRYVNDIATKKLADTRDRLHERQHAIRSLISETLRRAGEREYVLTGGGYLVNIGRSRWDGFVTSFHIECTNSRDLAAGAIQRYALALARAGWFAEEPGPEETVVFVEVIGDALFDRAPDWLCEKWSALD